MIKNCQVCGGPLFGWRSMGMNRDGSINVDYCSACYRFGDFTKSQE